MQPRRKCVQCDGEVRIVYHRGEHVLERLADAARTVNVPFGVGNEERREEGQTLDMIPVRVRDKDVAVRRAPLLHQRFAECVRTGARVDNKRRP